MTRLCSAAACALALLAAPTIAVAQDQAKANTDEDKPTLVVTGEFWTRYEARENYNTLAGVPPRANGSAELDATFYRARLGLGTTPMDVGKGRVVSLLFEPQASGIWGPSGGLADAGIGLHQGVLRIAGEADWLDVGRFEMAYGEHLVIGSVGWHQTARSFDGARAHFGLGGGAWLDTFVTMILEGNVAGEVDPATAGDRYFTGVYAGLGPKVGAGTELDAYLLTHVVPKTTSDGTTTAEITIGSRFKKKVESLVLRVEGGVQLGERTPDVSVLAFQIDGDVAVQANDQLTLAGGGFLASGDGDPTDDKDNAWNQLYPTAHKFLGLMDVMGSRSNILGGVAKARFAHSADLTLAADAQLFLRPETPDGVDSYAGAELDAWAAHKLGKGLGLRGQYSVFLPNDAGPLAGDDLVHYVEVELSYKL